MRLEDIKFKAKRLDNGEWTEGDLVHSYDGGAIIILITKDGEHGGAFSVDLSTVCQYTGLKDKDDNEIWEHDLVENTFDEVEVVYNAKGACFDFVYPNGSRCAIVAEIDGEMKVIGNKFDKEEGK